MFDFLKRKIIYPEPVIREEALMVISLIQQDKDWVKSRYTWFHPSGINLWVGNLDIGVSAKWLAKDKDDYLAMSDYGAFIFTKDEYRQIKAAIEGVKAKCPEAGIVARRILDMYGE